MTLNVTFETSHVLNGTGNELPYYEPAISERQTLEASSRRGPV